MPLGDGDWLAVELAVERVDESDGRVEESAAREALSAVDVEEDDVDVAEVPRFTSVGGERPQSDFPLEAVFAESWQ